MNNNISDIRENLLKIYGLLGPGQTLCPADVTRFKSYKHKIKMMRSVQKQLLKLDLVESFENTRQNGQDKNVSFTYSDNNSQPKTKPNNYEKSRKRKSGICQEAVR